MRRIAMIAATALTALACALLPSGALAHGHHRGHHHARRHHGRRLHAGLSGAAAGSGSQPTGNSDNSGGSGTQGTDNVAPTPGTQQGNAGKIVSFTEGVLTIQLGEGEKATTVSGKVTEETEIHCIPAPAASSTPPSPSTTSPSDEDGWSGWGQSGQGQQGGPGWGHDDQGSGDDGEGDPNSEGGGHCQCATANLTPGTIVHRAELLLTESGAVFREIELVH